MYNANDKNMNVEIIINAEGIERGNNNLNK